VELDPDLFTRHGVMLGMTGSGKTGLGLSLIEELVQAGIPVLAIDPKGDLPNLALLFPELCATDFMAWTDPAEARRAGLTPEVLAAGKAESWKAGLADWGLNGLSVARLKNKLDLRLLTPGSSLGRPIDLLGDFQPPSPGLDAGARAELASGIITGLLSLVEQDVDPLRDPRHVLLVAILSFHWDKSATLSLEDLITHLVDPPFPKVGVFPVDRFLSPDDRMKLALQLNNLVAAPGFKAWRQGEALDVGALMASQDGRTPVNLFYLAHLEEKERQFFVGRLMSQVLTWSRTLTGSSSLRALVYFDEVAGYLPPYPLSPPSKAPLLTMLKQSRAVGVGLCLATQNPVDLDYKALSNIGTWMIGRLQTQQDRERVREGLISAAGGLSSSELDAEFSKLQPRSFLLKTPAASRPSVLRTRWTMCYLRGPVTLTELNSLPMSTSANGAEPMTPRVAAGAGQAERATPPPAPRGFGQSFVDPRYAFGTRHGGAFEPHKQAARADGKLLFEPALRATFKLQFSDSKESFVWQQVHHYVAFPLRDVRDATGLFASVPLETECLLTAPPEEGVFTELPDAFDQTEELAEAQKSLADHLYRTLTATRYVNRAVQLYSRPEETREAFLERCRDAAENLEDEAAVKLRQKMQGRLEKLEAQMVKAKDKVTRLSQSATGKKIEGLWNAGEMLLSMFTKRKKSFSTVLSKSRQAAEASTRSSQAEEVVVRLQQEILEVQQELETALVDLDSEFAERAEAIESTEIRLARKDITVDVFEVLWIPVSARI
jgi:hypothetical protein